MQLARTHRLDLGLCAQTSVDQTTMETLCLGRRLERHRILGNAACAEIVGHAADRNDQRIVADGARRSNLASFVVESRGEMHLLFAAIEPDHFAEAIAETVPMRLSEVIHLILSRIDAARRDRMQQWLPQMSPSTFDQGD